MTTPIKSRVFSSRRPNKPHILQQTGGVAAEVQKVRDDTERGFLQLQIEAGGTTVERLALGLELGADDRGLLFYDTDLSVLKVWNGGEWVDCCNIDGGGIQIYGLAPIQTISSNSDQFQPTTTYHRFVSSGGNFSLSGLPTIDWPGAVPGQIIFLQNVGAPGTGHITLNTGGGTRLALSNSNSRIDELGSMHLIYDGTNWIEFTHTQAAST